MSYTSILIIIGGLIIVATIVGLAWRYAHLRYASLRLKAGIVALCIVVLIATGSLTVFTWPRPTHPLNRAALLQLYTTTTGNIPVLYDPLHEQDANSWETGTWRKGDSCGFRDGAYHLKSVEQEYYSWCIARAPQFSNFAVQVQMNILTGDGGGLVFRADGKQGDYYYFRVGQDGTFALYRYISKADRQELETGTAVSIHQGRNQLNLLCVIANGSSLALFVNKQPIAQINDGAYRTGQIGLAADEDDNTTDVAYNNLQVWTF